MLTSIPRFARVMEANVGPRFAEYATYTRPGVSLRVVAATPIFEQPARAYVARAMVTRPIFMPFGYATASAELLPAPAPAYKARLVRGTQVVASATVLGSGPTQEFGYCV